LGKACAGLKVAAFCKKLHQKLFSFSSLSVLGRLLHMVRKPVYDTLCRPDRFPAFLSGCAGLKVAAFCKKLHQKLFRFQRSRFWAGFCIWFGYRSTTRRVAPTGFLPFFPAAPV
jgi:hypothetical protein